MASKGGKSSSRKGGNRMLMELLRVLAPFGYGMVRQKIASNMPEVKAMSNYSDELILGGGAYAVGLFSPKFKFMTNAIKDVEFARIGEKLANRVPLSANGGAVQTRSFVTGATF